MGRLRRKTRGLDALAAPAQNHLAGQRQLFETRRGTRDLVREGYLPRNAQLEQERAGAELNARMSELQANIQRTGRVISELKLRVAQRRQETLREVQTQLAEVRREVAASATS